MDNPLVKLALFWLLLLMEIAAAVGSAIGLYASGILSRNWAIVGGAIAIIVLFLVMYDIYKKWFK